MSRRAPNSPSPERSSEDLGDYKAANDSTVLSRLTRLGLYATFCMDGRFRDQRQVQRFLGRLMNDAQDATSGLPFEGEAAGLDLSTFLVLRARQSAFPGLDYTHDEARARLVRRLADRCTERSARPGYVLAGETGNDLVHATIDEALLVGYTLVGEDLDRMAPKARRAFLDRFGDDEGLRAVLEAR